MLEKNEFDWIELVDSEIDHYWLLAENRLKFDPYGTPKIRSADLVYDVRRASRGQFYEDAPVGLRCFFSAAIESVRGGSDVVLLDWHHFGYKFSGEIYGFPSSVEFPSNGDYFFVYLNATDCWVFCDGVEDRVHVYGKELVEWCRRNQAGADFD